MWHRFFLHSWEIFEWSNLLKYGTILHPNLKFFNYKYMFRLKISSTKIRRKEMRLNWTCNILSQTILWAEKNYSAQSHQCVVAKMCWVHSKIRNEMNKSCIKTHRRKNMRSIIWSYCFRQLHTENRLELLQIFANSVRAENMIAESDWFIAI